MVKIALIGAGSLVFARKLCNDVLLTPALQDCTLSLMDIDAKRLAQSQEMVQSIIDYRGVSATLSATIDRKEAVTGADYVITTFQVGGLEAYAFDIEIPFRYGVDQCVGDTLGPGGVFRGLRSIPVLIDLCHELDKVAPDALLLNYVNPMAANCSAATKATGRPVVGLCNSVQGTGAMLARWIGIHYEEVTFLCAGINHQAFFLQFRKGDEDLYPQIREASKKAEVYAEEPLGIQFMNHFGYFPTEDSAHLGEYLPYFRKNPQMVTDQVVPLLLNHPHHLPFDYGRTGGYLRYCRGELGTSTHEERIALAPTNDLPAERSEHYVASIMEAIETNQSTVINGNVLNYGLIENLPHGCCVEVPCLVNGNGIQPIPVGNLPPQLAAINRTNINVQELIVEAALTGNKEAVYQAVMLDPLAGAVCTLSEIREMVDELFETQAQWLPQFNGQPI
ncbi:MAG: alpha-galactosidase [Anaerolineales bacterium]|nr:alpha-galactosidase [Anaerolineales bacterium]